jgi:hypothetical protein
MLTRRALLAAPAALLPVSSNAALPRGAGAGGAPGVRVSPYDFATMASTSSKLLYGGHIIEVPVACGGPNTDYSYDYIIKNAFTGPNLYANWVLPQIKRWKQNGGNNVRHHGDATCVLTGAMTQAAYNAYWTQVANDCRDLGMTFSTNIFVGPQLASAPGGPYTNDQWWAVMASLIANVFEPNRDVVSHFEPGMNETDLVNNATIPFTLDMCARARVVTTIPIAISGACSTNIAWMDAADIDLVELHNYPSGCGSPNTWQGIGQTHWDSMKNSQHRRFLLSENGIPHATYNDTQQATYYNAIIRSTFGHPDMVGFVTYAGYGPNPSGDFHTFGPESCPVNALDPTRIWADTPASLVMLNLGSANRKLSWDFIQTGSPGINATLTNLPLTWVTHDAATPTETGAAPNTVIWERLNVALTGSISFTGNAGTTYRISFRINDENSFFSEIAHQDIVGSASNVAINLNGLLPTPWPPTRVSDGKPSGALSFWISAQRVSGAAVDATGVSLTANITFGVAP